MDRKEWREQGLDIWKTTWIEFINAIENTADFEELYHALNSCEDISPGPELQECCDNECQYGGEDDDLDEDEDNQWREADKKLGILAQTARDYAFIIKSAMESEKEKAIQDLHTAAKDYTESLGNLETKFETISTVHNGF